MATQNRKDAVLHQDGSWCYATPVLTNSTQGGMLVSAETPAWSIINFVGMKKAAIFMEEYFKPRQYLHVFNYSFNIITTLDDARDVPQIDKHKALLLAVENDMFISMQNNISHSTSEKL